LVGRLAGRLADDVPAGHLDAAQHAHQGRLGPLAIALAIDLAPQGLDAEGIAAFDMALEDVLDQPDDRLRPEARGIDLAQPLDAPGGDELEKDEIAPAEERRRIADDEGPELGDLHMRLPLIPFPPPFHSSPSPLMGEGWGGGGPEIRTVALHPL